MACKTLPFFRAKEPERNVLKKVATGKMSILKRVEISGCGTNFNSELMVKVRVFK